MIRVKRLVLDFLSVNCYLLWDSETMRGLIVDPGSSERRITSAVEACGMKPEAILLTHAHVDHIARVPELCAKYGIPVWLHEADRGIYHSDKNALLPWMDVVQGLPEIMKGDCPTAGMNLQVIHTPGHTPGGCCFYAPAEKFILTGDTMFRGTYGRTDLGGSLEEILRSIREKLLVLPSDTVVYPGHLTPTTIGEEKDNY